ncbi:hypothetical protein BDW22DRAFT_967584 [Trametopsis cervina]|nr:hypothetical protein BDW22DRAFT_967584 [Trametopsis cervina]
MRVGRARCVCFACSRGRHGSGGGLRGTCPCRSRRAVVQEVRGTLKRIQTVLNCHLTSLHLRREQCLISSRANSLDVDVCHLHLHGRTPSSRNHTSISVPLVHSTHTHPVAAKADHPGQVIQ